MQKDFVYIDESLGKVSIDSSSQILPFTTIIGPVEIGKNNIIGPHCVIGGKPESIVKTDIMPLIIGHDNIIRDFSIITCGTKQETVVRNNCFIFKGSKISHDCLIDDGVIVCGANIGGFCKLLRHCNIGMNTSIHQKIKVGGYAMIGMGSVVTKNILPLTLNYGVPSKSVGYNEKYYRKINDDIEAMYYESH